MKLKELRKREGYTQAKLAEFLNINQRTISDYEVGLSEPNIETLKKMSKLFRVSLDELVGNETNSINITAFGEEKERIVRAILDMTNSQIDRVSAFIKGMLGDDK